MTELERYYRHRVSEYEAIYAKPERQEDLARLKTLIPPFFADREILELACGTGYWTPWLLEQAHHLVGIDAEPATLEVAESKGLPEDRVRFRVGDVFDLPGDLPSCDAAFAGFWWSHIPIRRQREFLAGLSRQLRPGSRVMLLDNRYVEGSSTPIHHRDAEGNTYQRRLLADGSEHMVLKNFPGRAELLEAVAEFGCGCRVIELQYYWLLSFETE